MKKALLLFWHGLGDLICCTPALRGLYEQGYLCDIITLQNVEDSHLLDSCPYVGTVMPLIVGGPTGLGSPAGAGPEARLARKTFIDRLEELRPEYDKSFSTNKTPRYLRGGKIERNLISCGLPTNLDTNMEVFISQEAEDTALNFIDSNYPDGFIFNHTSPGHMNHAWNSASWIEDNLPDLPVFDCGRDGTWNGKWKPWEDINVSFVMAREANHRVLSSSVFMHACDAMNSEMDICHFGGANYHGLPVDPRKIKIMHGFDHGNVKSVWPVKE